jgi:hypothetical protein
VAGPEPCCGAVGTMGGRETCREAADELVRSMVYVSDSVCCCCGLGIPLSFLFNSFSTISAAVSRRGHPLPNVHRRRSSISGGS